MFIDFPEISTDVVIQDLQQTKLPQMVRIRQKYDSQHIEDIELHTLQCMDALGDKSWFLGKRICIAAGSRGIPHISKIIGGICRRLKSWGALPFVIPAMGSHGGGTAEGQKEVLYNYGITEKTILAPIYSSLSVVQYGNLSNGVPLYCDAMAAEADGIILVNKVKPHTDFRGKHESGLAKMIAVGLAKHKGAAAFHAMGFSRFAQAIPEAAEKFLKTMPKVWGVGIVQNAYDEICNLEIVSGTELMETDAHLLEIARKKMARFKFKELDVLVVDEIGKEISGFGHDPNVTGRANGYEAGFSEILKINKMLICGLTKQTHHNGSGISEADITTRRCLRDIDWGITWTNIITSTEIQGGKIPIYMNNDHDALLLALRTCNCLYPEKIRLARIKNTLQLHEIEVSLYLYKQISEYEEIEFLEGPYYWQFDGNGNFNY